MNNLHELHNCSWLCTIKSQYAAQQLIHLRDTTSMNTLMDRVQTPGNTAKNQRFFLVNPVEKNGKN